MSTRLSSVPATRRLPATLLASVALAASLAACKSNPPRVDPSMTGAIAAPMTQADFQEAVSYWEPRYTADDKDKTNALNYAAALLRVGRSDQALAVLQKTAINYPNDREVLAAYGKGLAAQGQLEQALGIIRRAQTPDRPDWKLLSAEAAILDQQGKNAEARRLYAQAIQIAPGEPTLYSNLGMSYTLTGDLPAAEENLRKAAALPNADSRVRQNLALVVGLQGRFDEAEKIARQELSPEQAEANIAYLRSMLADQNLRRAAAPTAAAPARNNG